MSVHSPETAVLAERAEKGFAHIQKGLLVAVGTALALTPDITEVMAEQLGQTPHIGLLRFE